MSRAMFSKVPHPEGLPLHDEERERRRRVKAVRGREASSKRKSDNFAGHFKSKRFNLKCFLRQLTFHTSNNYHGIKFIQL